jgi:hypothetical protein
MAPCCRDGTEPADPSPSGNGTWLSPDLPCTWQLASDGQHPTLDLSFAAPSEHKRRLSFYFDEQDGGLLLWNYAGDPDAWKYMEFKKST